MNSTQLIRAIKAIERLVYGNITAIQFEDGSGDKFNYQINGSAKWQFIDLYSIHGRDWKYPLPTHH